MIQNVKLSRGVSFVCLFVFAWGAGDLIAHGLLLIARVFQ